MKVVQINTVYKNGGSTGRIVYDLKGISETKGIESYVAFGYEYSPTNDKNTFRMESIPELKFSILQTRLFAHHAFYNKHHTVKLIKWLDTIHPDVIHLHNLHNHYINVQFLFEYIKEKNIPVVWTLHDCWSFTGWCAYFDYSNCNKWMTGCGDCPNMHCYPYTWFFDRSKKNYIEKKNTFTGVKNLVLVSPCNWLAELLSESFLSDYPVRVIRNGIDLSVFSPTAGDFREKYNLSDKKIILSVTMELEKRKGVEDIYKLAQMIDNEKEKIVMVGLTKSQIKTLPSGIIGIPKTNSPMELAKIYSAADVFINPTLEDNYPTTNLEAIACGTPVVTYKTGGSPESVFEGCGEVVDKGNIDMLYAAINSVLKKGKNTAHCKEIADMYFDKKKCFEKYIELYRELGEKNESTIKPH